MTRRTAITAMRRTPAITPITIPVMAPPLKPPPKELIKYYNGLRMKFKIILDIFFQND